MRILFFSYLSYENNNYKGGGWVNSLANILSKEAKHTIGIAYISKQKNKQSTVVNNISYFPIYHHISIIRKIRNYITHSLDIVSEENCVNKIIKEFKPDIIQLFGLETSFGSILNKIISIPVVVHVQGICNAIHNKWFPMGISSSQVWINSPIKEILTFNTTSDKYKRFIKLSHIEKMNFSIYKYYLGRTQWDYEIISLLSPNSKYYKCNEIIRPEFYNKKWEYKSNEKIIISSVSNGELYKGFDTILRTSIILKDIGMNFEWNIYGVDNGFSIQKTIEENIKSKFQNNNIKFRGKKNALELANILLNSDFFIHTSHIDNSSNAICEAMMLGIPTIATHVGGTPSIIENNINGFIVSDSEPYQIAYIIYKYYKNKEKLEQISNNSIITAHKRHNTYDIIIQLNTIYKDIIADFYKQKNNENIN